MIFAVNAGGWGEASKKARTEQDSCYQVSTEEAWKNSDFGARVRNPGNAKPRLEVTDSGTGDAKAQARGHAESPWAHLSEARWRRQFVSTVCGTFAAAQLPGEFRPAPTSIEPASELCDRISGKSGRVWSWLLPTRKSIRTNLGCRLYGLVALSTL